MTARIMGNLYAVTTFEPVTSCPDAWVIYCTLPIDIDIDGNPCDVGRYLSVVGVPPETYKSDHIYRILAGFRPISVNWLSYFWVVA